MLPHWFGPADRAVDAVELAVRALEQEPSLNAGRGSQRLAALRLSYVSKAKFRWPPLQFRRRHSLEASCFPWFKMTHKLD